MNSTNVKVSRLSIEFLGKKVLTFNKRKYELRKLPLDSSFCAVTADSKSRWPHGKRAYFRGVSFWGSRKQSPVQAVNLGRFTRTTQAQAWATGKPGRRKRKKKERALVLALSRFTRGLCLCLCLCLRRTCKPAFWALISRGWEVSCRPLLFSPQYESIHRLETNKLRNVAKLFAHLFYSDAIPWTVSLQLQQ